MVDHHHLQAARSAQAMLFEDIFEVIEDPDENKKFDRGEYLKTRFRGNTPP
jgi:hypothetical protein